MGLYDHTNILTDKLLLKFERDVKMGAPITFAFFRDAERWESVELRKCVALSEKSLYQRSWLVCQSISPCLVSK